MSVDLQQDLVDKLKSVESLAAQVEKERNREIESVSQKYQTRLQGLRKAAEGLREAIGITTTPSPNAGHPFNINLSLHRVPQNPETSRRAHGLQDAVRQIMSTQPGKHYPIDDLPGLVRTYGVTIDSQNPTEAIRSTLYAMKGKGDPIHLVGPKTWAWVPEHNNGAATEKAQAVT